MGAAGGGPFFCEDGVVAMMQPLMRIEEGTLAGMLAHVTEVRPEEGCGLLGGRAGVVCRHYPIPNLARSPHRFVMAAQAQIDALYAMADAGEELLATYHSHPHGPAGLSASDRAELPGGRIWHVVISWQPPDAPQVRVFGLDQMRVTEVTWRAV